MQLRFLSAFVALSMGASASAGDAQHGLRFDSPGVVDLAQQQSASGGKPLVFAHLDAATAAAILAAPAIAEDPPQLKFSMDEYGCKTPTCARENEAKRIVAAGTAIKRTGKRLEIAAGSMVPLAFVDWKSPASKTVDGDEERHWYLGRLPGSGYHRVEVEFGHDAPGSFLVNPQTGKAAFVHNGADLVAPSPGGLHLVTFKAEFPPFVLRVAALDAAGPRVELVCTASPDDDLTQAQFKGWRGADQFDLVIQSGARRTPVHIAHMEGRWSAAASDPSPGIVCSAENG
jgi:hypothetical protein